jgi:hypothetical protein
MATNGCLLLETHLGRLRVVDRATIDDMLHRKIAVNVRGNLYQVLPPQQPEVVEDAPPPIVRRRGRPPKNRNVE